MTDVCTCGTCGFQWQRGMSGDHSCGENLRKQLIKLQAENDALRNSLEGFTECPRNVDVATLPGRFDPDIYEHRRQVVYTLSVCHERLYQAELLLRS